MGLFRRKPQTIDAEHLLHEAQGSLGCVSSSAAGDEGTVAAATPNASRDFRLTVQDVFAIRGRGTVVTGHVEVGSVSVGSVVSIVRDGETVRRVKVTGVEMFRKTIESAVAGQNVGLLLDQTSREDVVAGDVLAV